MGLDLTLLPFDSDQPNTRFSQTVLSCERRTDLFQAIGEIEKQRGEFVGKGFNSYLGFDQETGLTCYTETRTSPYGDSVKYIMARDLKAIAGHEDISGDVKNSAVWAYISYLPDDTKVALYWH